MGRARKSNATGVYAKLVGLYPAAYREQYAQPMVQTFDDMLEAEPSAAGRLAIWARALWDLPSSVAKEYVTNGRGITMSPKLKIVIAGIVIILALANIFSFWKGILHARGEINIEKVSTTQLADAMQQDSFYSTYGNSALLFTGTVSNVQAQNGVMEVSFKTSHAYNVECQFTNIHTKIGDTLSVAAPGGNADRLPKGVLLHDCLLN